MKILGVRIDNLTKNEILEKIEFFLDENNPRTISDEKVRGKFHQIATVNPEFILRAQKDLEFKNILNGCSLNVADGIGLKYAFMRFGTWLKCRFAGVDLMHEILSIANKKKLSVFLAVNKDGLSKFEEVKKLLEKKYSNVIFAGLDIDPNDCSMLHVSCSMILLCNFGAPLQEVFINSVKNDTIRLAMGVGGSFDFVTGKVKRAPKIMQTVGLEWLWRFFAQPTSDKGFFVKRLKRIFNAVIVFPIRIILKK